MASPPQRRLCHDLRSAAAVVSRSRDVIFEILSWLPAKSLCRCRCVSKEWRTLTSDPAFVAVRRSRAEPLLVGMSAFTGGRATHLQLMDTDGTVVKRFRLTLRGGQWMLRASSGDLVCIFSSRNQPGTLLLDLATGKALPLCSKPASEDVAPSTLIVYSSCGRATRSGSLKAFRLVLPLRGEDTHLICKVLTLGDDGATWRHAQSPPAMVSRWYNNSSSCGVTVNGSFNFLSKDLYDVLSFDLDCEKWKVIHGPPQGFIGRKKTISIVDLNGTLCVARIMEPLVADIWRLTDSDKSLWVKTYSLPVGLFAHFVVPLRVLRLGGGLLFCLYDHRSKPVLQVYDPSSRECTNVKTSAKLTGRIGLCSSSLDPRFCG